MRPIPSTLLILLVLLVGLLLAPESEGASTNASKRVEANLRLENVPAGITSAGELALPATKDGPYPAVILLGGLGEGFQALTDELTRQGIAVLSFDSRGFGKSTGAHSFWNPDAAAEDASLWLRWLKDRPDIDRSRLGLIGHSQGGVAATLVAAQPTNEVGFVVLLASIGVPVLEWRVQQISDLVQSTGVDPTTTAKLAAFQRELFQNIVAAKDATEAMRHARETTTNHLARFTAEERIQLELTEAQADGFAKQAGEAWFRQFLAYDPRPALRQIRCPVFAVHGSADIQVSAKENLASIAAELKTGGNQRVKLLELPGLDHQFHVVSSPTNKTLIKSGGAFSPEVLRTVSNWIRETTAR